MRWEAQREKDIVFYQNKANTFIHTHTHTNARGGYENEWIQNLFAWENVDKWLITENYLVFCLLTNDSRKIPFK